MRIGLDIGCTLTKIAAQSDTGEVSLSTRQSGDWRTDGSALELLFAELVRDGAETICVTGAGAEAFVRGATGRFKSVLVPPGDAVTREIVTQAAGVRQLLAHEGIRQDEFLLVSVGSGTSFTLVTPTGIRQYMPGLSVGGLYIMGNCAVVGVGPEEVERLAAAGEDPDLLMRHVFPGTGILQGEYVVGSYGRLGRGVEPTPANVCRGHLKYVATAILGQVMDIRQNAAWAWRGPVVYIGTPVSEYRTLQDYLQLFTVMLGMEALFPERGRFACALGALAAISDGTAAVLPPAGLGGRIRSGFSRRMRLVRLLTSKLTRRR